MASREMKTLSILVLHGFGGDFGNGEDPETFHCRLRRELQRRLPADCTVHVVAPSAPNRVSDKYPAWLAGDQRPLGLVAGFAYSDDWTKAIESNSMETQNSNAKLEMPPKLDSIAYPNAFGPAICEAAERDIAERLTHQRMHAKSPSAFRDDAALSSVPTAEGTASSVVNPALEVAWRGSTGWSRSLKLLQEIWSKEGPFDGILGFSQGCLAALLFVAEMQMRLQSKEPHRQEKLSEEQQPDDDSPLRKKTRTTALDGSMPSASEEAAVQLDRLPKFLILIGAVGIRPWPLEVHEFWPSLISAKVRILNIIGSEDRSCAPCRSREVRLVAAGTYIEYEHDVQGSPPHGGHFVPSTPDFYSKLSEFICESSPSEV